MTKTLHRALDIKIEKLTKNIGSGVGHFYSGWTGLQIVPGKVIGCIYQRAFLLHLFAYERRFLPHTPPAQFIATVLFTWQSLMTSFSIDLFSFVRFPHIPHLRRPHARI